MGVVVATVALAFGLLYFLVAAEERRLEASAKGRKR
jgi:hypothetical protein